MDPQIDRSESLRKCKEGKLPKKKKNELIEQENIEDIWRLWSSKVKDFTF